MTPLVKGWLDDPSTNDGIAILPTDGSDIRIFLDSKESGKNPVEVEVSNVPPAPVGTVGGPMGGQLIGGGTSPATLNNMATRFVGMFHGQPEVVANTIGVPMPGEGSVTDLHVHLDVAPNGAGKKYTFTVFKEGVFTLVTCDIVDTATSCKDDMNSACFQEGDLIAIESVPANTPDASAMTWSAVFTPEDCLP